MSKYFMVISIGPIQDFIASARRCQDLWFGSWLLSDLARVIAESIKQKEPSQKDPLIFPADLNSSQKPSVANKIVAIVEQNQPQDVANEARNAMQKRLVDIADHAFSRFKNNKYFQRDLAFKQIEDMMEFVWVAVPYDGTPNTYAQVRATAENLLASRKNTKNWGPVGWHDLAGAGVPKSSLDGIRESVLLEKVYDDYRQHPEELRRQFLVKPGERLCGVGMLKRCGSDPDSQQHLKQFFQHNKPIFHSTSHVACGPLLARITAYGVEGCNAFLEYKKSLEKLGVDLSRFRISWGQEKNSFPEVPEPFTSSSDLLRKLKEGVPRTFGQQETHGFDGTLLYENRLPEITTEYLLESVNGDQQQRLKEAKSALRKLRKQIHLREGHIAYYAYLLADGDAMGKAIDALAKLSNGMDAHRKLGKCLEAFSASCRKMVEQAGGSLIYAGGDDVLALCPLHTVLRLARNLRDAFAVQIAFLNKEWDEISKTYPQLEFRVPTLSVGLGICHHLEPMSRARELAKTAEKAAKEAGRNALAIVMEKRSGGLIQIARQWSDQPQDIYQNRSLDIWLNQLAFWMHQEVLPVKFAFDLEKIVAPLVFSLGNSISSNELAQLVQSLSQLVLSRKRSGRGKEKLVEEVATHLNSILQIDAREPLKQLQTLSHEMQVAKLFLEAYRDAYPEL